MYSHELLDKYINRNKNSRVVNSILNNEISLYDNSKEKLLSYFGYDSVPNKISIYVNNTIEKDNLLNSIKLYNKGHNNKIIYVDTMKEMIDLVKNIIKIITVILITFSVISVLVASIMIMVLTNTSVLERIKEIGILRSLGGRKRDITRLFNLENMIIGIISSSISLIIVYLMINPLNRVLDKYLEIGNIVKFDIRKMLIISLISIIFTVISGYIPSKMASNREIIDCFNN
jgi:putative ABC transport system permease protein